jgi:branched-subunit amino acid aminotransferase/4-amino-4-deoxychorismate lyase
MDSSVIFLDGQTVQAGADIAGSLAPGVIQGKGVFETIRVEGGGVFAWDEHMLRLARGLKALGIRPPLSRGGWEHYLGLVLRAGRFKDARARLSVWKDRGKVRTAIVCQRLTQYSDADYQKGFKAVVSSIRRNKTRFSHIKSLDYGCFRLAFQEARAEGYDEAILLNNRRQIVEGSRSNIFLIRQGVVRTPAARCGCLKGITRQTVLRCARRMGIPCGAVEIDVRQLGQADEAFLTNSLVGVMPLTRVGNRHINRGIPGPLTRKLKTAYQSDAAGRWTSLRG